ncbi:multiheme c-type cytochrome [Acanthopleuribacter pedis]|uniref:Cytochrome c-552/4 domain-containing protein n=1 Tax=Acanthopleuribacter pedis TaxID=442870 RepID=A0A8J7Q9V9_9BACT|nr:multiheme c-type cytochrome [Acanthopleuribacter pedis]MBO1319669.1 hypothetical protein [Acanthopleuribacter pedis]
MLLSPCLAQIQGIVVAEDGQHALPEAQVRIQGSSLATLSDDGGFFSLDDTRPFPFKLVAGAQGYYNRAITIADTGALENLIFELEAVDTTVIPDHPFNAPASCSGCHPNQFSEWLRSPMAQTGLNTWVFDLLSGDATEGGTGGFVYQRDSVHRLTHPNSDCSACHSPVHWLSDIENAGMGDFHNPNQAMREGVQCEVCHRALEIDESKLNWPGVFPASFRLLRGPQIIQFGLLGDADYADNSIMRPGYNPLMQDTLCASCHEDNNDHDGDGDFEDAGSVPHETTYSEYLRYRETADPESVQTCVGCHMPATNSAGFCSFSNVIRDPGTIRSHELRGTSPDYLENALTMTVETTAASVQNPQLSVAVNLTNDRTGHAVPTGIAIRNMLLLVEVRDSNGLLLNQTAGTVVDSVGGVGDSVGEVGDSVGGIGDSVGGSADAENGYYAGLPGQAFYKNLARGDGERVFYTEADRVLADNRIQPGETYRGVFAFEAGPSSDADGPLSVDVRLIYRRAFFDLIQAKGWVETGLGDPLPDIAPPHFGTLMERAQETTSFCDLKGLDVTPGIQIADINLLTAAWRQPLPYPFATGETTSVLDLAALVSCLPAPMEQQPAKSEAP